MIALARSSCSRATANSPRVASSDCSSERSSPTIAGAVNGVGWSSAVARRAHPPTLLTSSAPRSIHPPCTINFWVFVYIDLSCKSRRSQNWPRLVKHPSIGRIAPPVAVRAAGLLQQPHLFDHHAAGGGPDPHPWQALLQRRLDLHVVEADGMAQRNQLRRALRRERPRHLAHPQHVALGHLLLGDEPKRFPRHPDRSLGDRGAHRDRLLAHVHHAGPARFVHMRELHPAVPKSLPSTAATSCGFRLPWASVRASSTCAIARTTLPVSSPDRACSRSRSSRPSSISVNPPRAWNGCCPSANAYRRTGPAFTAAANRSAASPPRSCRSPSARTLPMLPSAAATRCATARCPVTPSSR